MYALSLLAFLVSSAAPPDSPSTADLATAVVAQKAKMPNRYTLKYRVEVSTPTATPPLAKQRSFTVQLWRDGNKFRVDHFDATRTPAVPGDEDHPRNLSCENCEKEGYGFVTVIKEGPQGPNHAVEFRMATYNFDNYCTHFDWRFLGLSNDEPCGYKRLKIAEEFPSYFMRPGLTVRNEMREDQPCLAARFKDKNMVDGPSVWLSEREEFHPVFFEQKFIVDNVPEFRTTKIIWQKLDSGHLYPKSIQHYTKFRYGLDTFRHEQQYNVTFLHADFGSPIDPAVFTFAGFGLNENQPVFLPDVKREDSPRWRNGKLDYDHTLSKEMAKLAKDQPAVEKSRASSAYPGQGNTMLIVSVATGVLAIAAAIAVVIRRRRAAV